MTSDEFRLCTVISSIRLNINDGHNNQRKSGQRDDQST
jgi:hypothetical protein